MPRFRGEPTNTACYFNQSPEKAPGNVCWAFWERSDFSFCPWIMVSEGESQSCRGWGEDTHYAKATQQKAKQRAGVKPGRHLRRDPFLGL